MENNSFFYQNLITLDNLRTELEKRNLEVQEINSLLRIVENNLHHEIITFTLSQIPTESYFVFVALIKEEPENPKIWDWLEERARGIKEKMVQRIKESELEFIKELNN